MIVMRCWPAVLLLNVIATGCGSNETYLPKPRPPEPEAPASSSVPVGRTTSAASPVVLVESNVPVAATVPGAAPTAASPPAGNVGTPATSPPGETVSPAGQSPEPAAEPVEITESQRRQRTVEQLTRIGQALEAFRRKNNRYPSPSYYAGQLSWRVALLPFLNRDDLIVEKDEPWTHPVNKRLLTQIPDEFQLLGRSDGKTAFVLLTGEQTAFPDLKGPRAEDFPDGLGNTILVVEVDDANAVPWTAADDYPFARQSVQRALFNRHKDCCYVLLGDAAGVRRIPANISDEHLTALITPAGYEPVSALQVTQPPTTDDDTKLIEQLAANPVARFAAPPPAAAASATSGQPTASAAGQSSDSATGSAGSAASAVNTHVARLLAASEQAVMAGREHDALQLYYAAVLASSDDDPWQFRMKWVNGLKRPTVAVRWGVGVLYTGPSDLTKGPDPIAPTSPTQLVALKPQAQELRAYTGELGDRLLEHLQGMVSNGQSGEFLTALVGAADEKSAAFQSRSSSQLEPGEVALLSRGVTYLGVGSDRVLAHLAQREGVDILVTFDVQVKTVGKTNQPHNTTTIIFKDMRSQSVLYSTTPLNNIRVDLARRDPLQVDPVIVVVEKLSEFLDQQLSVTSLPVGISPENVSGRIAALSHPRHENPLPVLAEVRFYRTQNLITVKQLADAYLAILGEEPGAQLAAGTDREKIAAIKRWLPKDAQLDL
jgi:hypothetical protein